MNREEKPLIVISIVSHGHWQLIAEMFNTYVAKGSLLRNVEFVVVANLPETDTDSIMLKKHLSNLHSLQVKIIQNAYPIGFGANQNQVFSTVNCDFFCIANPDITLDGAKIQRLVDELRLKHWDLICPNQITSSGVKLDSKRALVTPWQLLKRYLQPHQQTLTCDIVDWYNGAFMLFRAEAFKAIGGFDERYFMYCEDVDICLRMRLAGHTIGHSDIEVIHDTQRSTMKNWKHFRWHLRSMIRLWTSSVYWRYLWKRKSLQKIA